MLHNTYYKRMLSSRSGNGLHITVYLQQDPFSVSVQYVAALQGGVALSWCVSGSG
jgi:hypothetical protein